ncbi:MAG: polysaccharide biosynthesis protein [Gammaproteobacteria bacterium]|jgi:UDP-glucose 4-epimerase|nr:polysaccharide biosynthesis protein [Gammaproteobacteria bacterium]MBI5615826.1 polysaccharide biosynthesis protein [Gammaproteobacteria bacterium]
MDYRDKSVLVTGGTGSFGNFVVRRLLNAGVKEVRVLSRDEKKQYDMRVFYQGRSDLTFVIGDVRNAEVVHEAMAGIDMVFHAAALKQVPTCERHPHEAVRTNVLGAENLVAAALAHAVQCFVMISTDKAVKPVNVMGMTKALQERIVLSGNLSRLNRGTRFCCVRYGNVLRSRGSVVPFFRRQLSLGQTMTVTDERMTRFLLTLNEAIDLVLYAADHSRGGEIFVRKAPAARVTDIAKVLAEEAGKPFEYKVIGILPGEKLHEILVSEEELVRVQDCGEYYTIQPWWDTGRYFELDYEFGSSHSLVATPQVKELIALADAEFDRLEMSDGEFAKF